MKKHRTLLFLGPYTLLFFAACMLFRGNGYSNESYVLISVATFLYGIFIAFSIFNHQTRLSRIRELLRTDDSYLLSMYRQSLVFGEATQEKIQKLIDNYLIVQIDYKITEDFHESAAAYKLLSEYIIKLKPNTPSEAAIYQNMVGLSTSSATNRKLVGTLVGERTTRLEWFSIVTLHLLIAFLIFSFNTGTLLSGLLSTLVVITGAVMLVVLHHLNTLTWQEDKWIWDPLYNLFTDLQLIPYYPENAIHSGRATVPAGRPIRMAQYKHPYPDMSDKEILVVTP